MKTSEIRQAFLSFFDTKAHTVVESSSLVPGNDPTLLFTNAGMVQFKDVFLGDDVRSYSRAASSQRCVRAGGKHNDLENVGYTARHHTLFEMLGNFSFGDYFKRDAIQFAWEFLTQVLKLPEERLWITVHISDDEAANIWLNEVGASPERFSRLDEDNFWQMGDTGPCGPSSEIFYDHGADVPGGPPGSENDDLDRYIEIWNLVFMQYERQCNGELKPLPKPSVDTGMGLERIAAVMQGVHSNYDIDIFQHLLTAIQSVIKVRDGGDKSLCVIADHIRSCAFLVADGVIPSNEGRGYVLRRIIRRAIRHGHKLGQKSLFFYSLVPALVEVMGEAYSELRQQCELIQKVLKTEEEQFAKTLGKGLKILEDELAELDGMQIPGELVFKLHDTYGFPADLTNDIAREKNLTIDEVGFEKLMEEQKQQSSGGKFDLDYTDRLELETQTHFEGYERLEISSAVTQLFDSNAHKVNNLLEGQDGIIILDSTPFYANSGGQVGDTGFLHGASGQFQIYDCQKQGSAFLHIGKVILGRIDSGEILKAKVAGDQRRATALNHSATHLLHASLRKVLGEHVTQKGSLVDPERLRFDFSHFQALTDGEVQQVEDLVNEQVRLNSEVITEICDRQTAKDKGAMALFGEKYGDEVRVLSMGGDFSVELCGGTHVRRTGDIALFKIVSESGIAAGVRRIEAITGLKALGTVNSALNTLEVAARRLKTSSPLVLSKLDQLLADHKKLEKSLNSANAKLAALSADSWLSEAEDILGVKVLAKQVDGGSGEELIDLADKLKSKLGSAVVLLAGVNDNKVALVASVTKDICKQYKAGDLIKYIAPQIDGKGGGRPDMARGAGSYDSGKLVRALGSVGGWVKEI